MIVSFHPIFESDVNRLCAGRSPDESDLAAIQAADAVILPQGCKADLFEMASRNCRYVFPDYHARFAYPGKTGQIRLFENTGVRHPRTQTFTGVTEYRRLQSSGALKLRAFPQVLKFDWGGEGDTVFLINDSAELDRMIERIISLEASGQAGFLLQEYIPGRPKSVLRVVTIGTRFLSYWRTGDDEDQAERFPVNVSTGARIDPDRLPDLQDRAIRSTRDFCRRTGINLAGFDFLFSETDAEKQPIFLEINYFFGRRGLGGSEAYYAILCQEIQSWINALPGMRPGPS